MKSLFSRRQFGLLTASVMIPFATGSRKARASGAVTIIADDAVAATIVVPKERLPSVSYAAKELAWHLGKATSSSAVVIGEDVLHAHDASRPMIYLGRTRFAIDHRVDTDACPPEGCIIRTIGKDLCIAGVDHGGDPLDEDTSAGTLFGVYELLETYLGVRWLWPGELGTFVPSKGRWVIDPIDRICVPKLMMRHVRFGAKMKSETHPELGFSASAEKAYSRAQAVYMRRHRLGRRYRLNYGHAFTDWWKKYGKAHPEWFQLVDGRRGPTKRGGRYSMCISNPVLHRKIVERADLRRYAGALSVVNAVENDIPGLCQCNVCRALDGPEPADYRNFVSPGSKIADLPVVTDRYARSWLAIQRVAARENPKATVIGYAYFNYFAAPSPSVKLNENVLVGFCPSSWFYPRTSAEQAWMKQQWNGWAATGARIFMRTNYFLDGYCMPFVFAHQFADDFRNAALNGLVGTDFDSLTGQWATQGPTLYLMMCLQTRPSTPADVILDEYYSCFGAAADHIRAYFSYWETYTARYRDSIDALFEERRASRWGSFAKAADLVFPETCFAPAEHFLDSAEQAAADDAEASERVSFLRLGLEHARLCVQAARALAPVGAIGISIPDSDALKKLIAFRRSHETTWISNFNHCAWVEEQSWF
ncbi:DUF4838 domain-containing protein [Pararhizobium mangrovi]|nr:DUF4838 domain-containing protein [Pararhizobium mangrovi]